MPPGHHPWPGEFAVRQAVTDVRSEEKSMIPNGRVVPLPARTFVLAGDRRSLAPSEAAGIRVAEDGTCPVVATDHEGKKAGLALFRG
jgi:hypothetical protein